jgi:ribonuclease HIII
LSNTDLSISSYIGTDESGKGDYFGPLVIGSVCVTEQDREKLISLDVKDSKKTTDKKARRIAESIFANVPCTVVAIGSEKYNELYSKIGNLNRLLAWGHARAIENLLDKCEVDLAVTDQFGDPKYVKSALMKKGREIRLIQETKAEKHIGVAAASIIARAKFLEYLDRYSSQHDMTFPKGAGPNVDLAGVDFCRRYGHDNLYKVAKVHFKNSKKIEQLL